MRCHCLRSCVFAFEWGASNLAKSNQFINIALVYSSYFWYECRIEKFRGHGAYSILFNWRVFSCLSCLFTLDRGVGINIWRENGSSRYKYEFVAIRELSIEYWVLSDSFSHCSPMREPKYSNKHEEHDNSAMISWEFEVFSAWIGSNSEALFTIREYT